MSRRSTFILLMLLLVVTTLIYLPGLWGFFILDDYTSIVDNPGIQITRFDFPSLRQAWFAESSGPLGRPVSALSFAINHAFSGLDGWAFKATNLLIHLLNGLLLWTLLQLLLKRLPNTVTRPLSAPQTESLSLLVTAAWLLHPLNLTGVLYVVQRMTSLAACFILLGLCCYLLARTARRHHDVHAGWLLGTLTATGAAALSKENGLLLPVFALLIEFILFSGRTTNRRDRIILMGFFSITILIPGLLVLGLLWSNPATFLGGYRLRDFTLFERLLTQARVLWFHVGQLFVPRPDSFNLYHDSFPVSRGFMTPPSTLPALLGILAAIGGALWLRRRQPVVAFGVLFFLVGHALESTILPLELVYEHRNYLPGAGLLLAGGYLLLYLSPLPRTPRTRQLIALGFIALCTVVTGLRVSHWRSPLIFATVQVQHRPDSVRARNELGQIHGRLAMTRVEHRDRHYQLAREHLERAVALQPANTISLINLIEMSFDLEKPVDPAWFEALHQRYARERFFPHSDVRLHELLVCQLEQRCHIDPEVVGVLLNAALGNPQFRGTAKANLLFSRAYFLALSEGDGAAAVVSAREAVAAYPGDLRYRLNLVGLLISLGRLDEAGEELTVVRELDRRGALALQIRRQADRLRQARNNADGETPATS